LLNGFGVVPLHTGRLLLRKRVIDNKEAWLFTNPTGKDITEIIDVGSWFSIEDLMEGEVEISEGFVHLTVKGLNVRVLIVSGK